MTVIPQTNRPSPQQFVQLLPHVVKLFPKAPPGRVLDNLDEFVAQTMDGGDWPSVIAVNQILGNEAFQRVLRLDVPNVFDVDSWFFWHEYYGIKPTNPNPRLRIKNFQKFKGPRNFSDQNKVGTHGEQEIRKAYGPTLSTLKPQDFKSDMYLKNIRQHAEIKADGYDMRRTQNFFIETISDKQNNTTGGPKRAVDHRIGLFVYYFAVQQKCYWFEAATLHNKVSDLVKKQNISLSEVHNQNQQTKEQWYTLGYRIPRAYLAPLAIAVHDLSKPIAPPDTVPIAIWAALHGRDNILMVA